jgi:hypothetical protein
MTTSAGRLPTPRIPLCVSNPAGVRDEELQRFAPCEGLKAD